jgi:phenol 2-monooxygenase
MGAQSNVDLLIVGAGPAGLITAAWASQYKIRTRIIDENPSRVENGRADGLQSRTMEILHSFGLAEHITKQAAQINEICSWVSLQAHAERYDSKSRN